MKKIKTTKSPIDPVVREINRMKLSDFKDFFKLVFNSFLKRDSEGQISIISRNTGVHYSFFKKELQLTSSQKVNAGSLTDLFRPFLGKIEYLLTNDFNNPEGEVQTYLRERYESSGIPESKVELLEDAEFMSILIENLKSRISENLINLTLLSIENMGSETMSLDPSPKLFQLSFPSLSENPSEAWILSLSQFFKNVSQSRYPSKPQQQSNPDKVVFSDSLYGDRMGELTWIYTEENPILEFFQEGVGLAKNFIKNVEFKDDFYKRGTDKVVLFNNAVYDLAPWILTPEEISTAIQRFPNLLVEGENWNEISRLRFNRPLFQILLEEGGLSLNVLKELIFEGISSVEDRRARSSRKSSGIQLYSAYLSYDGALDNLLKIASNMNYQFIYERLQLTPGELRSACDSCEVNNSQTSLEDFSGWLLRSNLEVKSFEPIDEKVFHENGFGLYADYLRDVWCTGSMSLIKLKENDVERLEFLKYVCERGNKLGLILDVDAKFSSRKYTFQHLSKRQEDEKHVLYSEIISSILSNAQRI